MKTLSSTVAFQDEAGNALANGSIILTLASGVYEIAAGGGQVVGQSVIINLDATGKISGTPQVWASDELTPQVPYTVTICGQKNGLGPIGYATWLLAGSSPIDLSQMVSTVAAPFALPGVVMLAPAADQHITQKFNLTTPQLNLSRVIDGTVYTANSAGLQAAHDDLPVGGGTIIVPPNTTLNLTATINISKNIFIRGQHRATSIIVAASGAPVFTPSGTINSFLLDGITFIGNGAGSKVIDLTGITASEGRLSITDCVISTFPNDAVIFGTSDYLINVERCRFVNCSGGLNIGPQSDSWVRDNFFENTSGSGSAITVVGPDVHIVGNYFIPGGHGGTGPDILLNPFDSTASNGGFIWIEDNKFGNDGGDSAARFKIQVNNANTGDFEGPVVIAKNNFFGVTGQSLIRLDNSIRSWTVDDNYVAGVGPTGFVIDDSYTVPNASFGQSQIQRTRFDTTIAPTPLFRNGGRGFWRVDVTENSAALPIYHSQHETPELRNRLLAPSEDMTNASWVKSGIVAATGVTDPLGTTRACSLTAASNGNISCSISNTSMQTHFCVRVWLQAGSLSQVRMGIKDNTVPAAFQQLPTFTLSSTWKEYVFDVYGVKPGDSFSFFILMDSAGVVNVALPMVNDFGGDYIPTTTNAMVVDTTSGARHEKNVIFNSAALARRIKANQGIAYVAADSAIALSVGWGNTAAVSAATGSFDQCLTFSVTANGTGIAANPTITITFKDGTFTNAPVFVVTRNDLSSPFNAPAMTWSESATALTITLNGTPLSGSVYTFRCLALGK